jgi:hypothetical protein
VFAHIYGLPISTVNRFYEMGENFSGFSLLASGLLLKSSQLVFCGIVSTGKRLLSAGEYCLQLQYSTVEE